jgi:hypothetical protein
MTTKSITSMSTAELVALGGAAAREELQRRLDKRIASGKKPRANVLRALGLAPETEAKAPKAKAASASPAPAPESGDDLDGMEWGRLRALGKSLNVKGRDRATLTARIRAAQAASSAPAPAPEPAPAPAPAPETEVDVEAVVKGVQALADEHLALRAEVARLRAAQAKPAASGGDWLKSVASALRQTGHLSA